jgi:hypothetical protein
MDLVKTKYKKNFKNCLSHARGDTQSNMRKK